MREINLLLVQNLFPNLLDPSESSGSGFQFYISFV